MDKLIRFLLDNTLVMFLLVAWVAGMIGNVLKVAKKRRGREENPRRVETGAPAPPRRSEQEVAAEMRRILGLDPDDAQASPSEPPPLPRPAARRDVVTPERPPTPVRPSTQDRRILTHVDPHVGERIVRRHSVQSGRVGKHEPGDSLGTLGGRVRETVRVRRTAVRFALDDLKKALVLNEILGKPLGLRELDDRLG